MENTELIPIDVFTMHYHVETAFVQSLCELQVIEIIIENNTEYIASNHLPQIEKLIRLHNDFDLDSDAIAVAAHLLDKISTLQTEISTLKSRLNIYE